MQSIDNNDSVLSEAAAERGDLDWWQEWASSPLGWRIGPRAVWRLRGPDAVRYANGQLTRDVEAVEPGRCALSCVTNAKGQFQFLVTVMRTAADEVMIEGDPGQAEALEARLGRYLIADDAELVAAEDWSGLVLYHVIPPRGVTGGWSLPDGVRRFESDRMGARGLDFWVPEEREQELTEALNRVGVELEPAEAVLPVDAGAAVSAAEFARILLKMPAAGLELMEKTLPPEAGLDRWAIDYRKGCYIGQEVLSRLFSVGRVNRQLVRLWADAGTGMGIRAGDELVNPVNPEVVVGKITSLALHPQLDRWAGLAYVKRSSLECTRLMTSARSHEPGLVINVIPESLIFA